MSTKSTLIQIAKSGVVSSTQPDRRSYEDRPGFDHEDGSCLKCKDGHAVLVINPNTGKEFHGCSNFPTCINSALIRYSTRSDLLMSADEDDRAWAEAQLFDKDWW